MMLTPFRNTMKGMAAVVGAALLVMSPAAAAAPPQPVIAGPWVELGAANDLEVRVVVGSGVAACPEIVADGKTIEPRQRGAADGDFPVTVCSASAPLTTAKLSGRR